MKGLPFTTLHCTIKYEIKISYFVSSWLRTEKNSPIFTVEDICYRRCCVNRIGFCKSYLQGLVWRYLQNQNEAIAQSNSAPELDYELEVLIGSIG